MIYPIMKYQSMNKFHFQKLLSCLILFHFFQITPLLSQKKTPAEIKSMVLDYQKSDRGPYLDIRWFCHDGTINMPKEPCGEKGGVQRARYRPEVIQLAESNRVYLGQILSTTPVNDFWDAENGHSRLKQFQLERFLRASDDGWILRKAQYYRGAIQVEDEEEWGIKFFETILENDKNISSDYYLLREAVKDIPHSGTTNLAQNIRALSKSISEDYPAFMNLRIKIHGQPEISDIKACEGFLESNRTKLSQENLRKFESMLRDMRLTYQPVEISTLKKYISKLPESTTAHKEISELIVQYDQSDTADQRVQKLAQILFAIREKMISVPNGKHRLSLFDLSVAIEEILFREITNWAPTSKPEMMEKIYHLSMAAVGCGFLEFWEWQSIKPRIAPPEEDMTLVELINWHEDARRVVEWSAGMTRGVYRPVVELYNAFEPLAYGFFDDKIRSSVLLPLGHSVSALGTQVSLEADFSNEVLDLSNQSSFRGLNPGYALGELMVVSGSPDEIEVSKDKIYVFNQPPSDLKPVAGIATVTEGNMVSHVQLLARNLGIPNAVLSDQNLKDLESYQGQRMFYAVSNRGTVLLKPESEMTDVEQKLFEVKTRSDERIRVPVDQLVLNQSRVLNLRNVKAKDSGKLCGPKAANLGQLKTMFPDKVVEGIVIPFSIFRQHMDLPLPDQSTTYWEFLNSTFQQAADLDENEAEQFVLKELERFRADIKQIKFDDDFLIDLEESFRSILGRELGDIAVFLRSDTNMEDLKDFTGAGLNLTLFNVRDREKILQGIRDVWASPYTERSYKWRQKYLLNPENVYPSILIIPSVNVDCSGVLITKGITSGNQNDQTIAFNRGVGGAVDGQAAESYLLENGGRSVLLSPAREPMYRTLPEMGGTELKFTPFDVPILNNKNLKDLRSITREVERILPKTPGIESTGPFDIELGFLDDQMWLFQIRPFVENKNAVASTYLESITPDVNSDLKIGESHPEKNNNRKSIPFWKLAIGALVFALIVRLARKKASHQ